MKYAVVLLLDQTIGYISSLQGGYTTKHPEALLFDAESEAQQLALKFEGDVEKVSDEVEFRGREDTW